MTDDMQSTQPPITQSAVRESDLRNEIKKIWQILALSNDSVLELRALWPKGIPSKKGAVVNHIYARDSQTLDNCRGAFEQKALQLNTSGYNVYTVMNPIHTQFSGEGAAGDSDIQYHDLLLIDIDRTGDTSFPATQEDLDAANDLANQVLDFMTANGCGGPIKVMSGNGYHLYFTLDGIDNKKEDTALIQRLLKNLAAQFDNEYVSIDTTVYNPSRITKVPGTIMRKGMASEVRPYRCAVVCDE
jgi:hypothetical protein